MINRTLSILAFLFTASSASNIPPRPAELVRDIAPRQTDSTLSQLLNFANKLNLTACIPRALPLATELPPIPSGLLNEDLFSQALSQTTLALSDVCKFSITGTNGPKFTSYLPTVYSWYSEHSSQIASVVSGCSSASPLVSTVEGYGSCSQVTAVISSATVSETGTASATDSGVLSIETDTVISTPVSSTATIGTTDTESTSTTSTQSDSTTSSVSQAHAPRETGFMVAAAAVAGFIGAVAAL